MKEIRNNDQNLTLSPETRLVEGYAVVFNSESKDLGGFTEVISSEALDGVVQRSDILCLLNHNEDKGVLARSKYGQGSLCLEVDEKGLKYMFEAPKTALGDELLEGLKRGDISTSSFAFSVECDQWQKKPDGSYQRVIKSIRELYDVSPVYRAAYDATTVHADTRGLDRLKAQEQQELKDYYTNLKKEIGKE